MAETQRSIATVLTNLPDNAAGLISPEDVRDAVETLRPDHGQMYVSSASATSFSDSTSFVNAAGTYTLLAGVSTNWDMNTNGQLRYVGTADRIVHVVISVSMISSSANQVVEFAIGKNGTAEASTTQSRKISTGADVGALSIAGLISVTLNDYITIMVKDTSWTASETVTCNYGTVAALSLGK